MQNYVLLSEGLNFEKDPTTSIIAATTITDEIVNDSIVNVSSVVPAQQNLPLVVQEVNGTTGHGDIFLMYLEIQQNVCDNVAMCEAVTMDLTMCQCQVDTRCVCIYTATGHNRDSSGRVNIGSVWFGPDTFLYTRS